MMTDDEMYQRLLTRFRDAQTQREQRLRTFLRTVPVFACILLLFAAGLRYRPLRPADTAPAELPVTEITAPAVPAASAAQQTGTEPIPAAETVREPETARTAPEETQTAAFSAVTEALSADAAQTEPVSSAAACGQTEPVPQSTLSARPAETTRHTQTMPPHTEPPAVQTTAPPECPSAPGTPGAVFTRRTVSLAEAQALFGHPLVPCERDDFLRCQAGIVSKNGNPDGDGAFCLSVTYEFADGAVTLTDWDKLNGSDGDLNAEQISYGGKLFYVERPGTYDNSLQVAYYTAGYDPFALRGIEYRAVFSGDADVYAVMELICALCTEAE